MGILSGLFGNNDNSNKLVKTSEMLNEDLYWQIVDESLKNSEDQDEQEEFLIKRLQKLSPIQIVGFKLRTDKLLYDTYNDRMWCAGYIMNGGCSDDGFEYFRCWVISRGKYVYYAAKANPDTLIAQATLDYYEFESFWYVALEAFTKKTGKNLHDYIADDFAYGEGYYPGIDFTWEEKDPATMKAICPNLFDKMWQ